LLIIQLSNLAGANMTQQQQEVVFYQDTSPVFISSSRAVFFNQTFLTRNIISVSIVEVKQYRGGEISFSLVGIVLLLVASFFLTITKFNSSGETGIFGLLMLGIGLTIYGVFRYITLEPHYALEIATPAGKEKVIVSPNLGYITTLQNALNQASIVNNQNYY
jgi:predicted phage tail protein